MISDKSTWKLAVRAFTKGQENNPEFAVGKSDLVKLFNVRSTECDQYRFGLMQMRDRLLKEHDIVIIPFGGGYKIANDEERLKIEAKRLRKRHKNALKREGKVLRTIDPSGFDEETAQLYDRQYIKNRFLILASRKIENGSLDPTLPPCENRKPRQIG